MGTPEETTRDSEWYVPKSGPRRLRFLMGMSFWPYTLMNASYVVIGSSLSPTLVHWDRVVGLAVVYLLATGVSAHAFDAIAPNRPWGTFLSRRQLFTLAVCALVPASGIGLYYSIRFAPNLLLVGIVELFFLFAYNLELLGGHFHTDNWFAFSWGMLPVLAGYVLQTNTLSPVALVGGVFGFLTAFVEINASRPYKTLMKLGPFAAADVSKFENILKGLVSAHLCLALVLVLYRVLG